MPANFWRRTLGADRRKLGSEAGPGSPQDIRVPEPQSDWRPPVRVTPSSRRRRTVAARFVDGVLEVRVPAWMGTAERARWAEKMRSRIERQVRRAGPTDAQLERRAALLNQRYFEGRLRWNSLSYAEQERR